MRANAVPSPLRTGKRHLLESCAIAAGIAALAYGGPALAQVAGAPLNPPGGVTISTDTVGHSTTVGVTGAETIIDWVPTDAATTGGDIDFLPAGSTWNFNGNGSSNYIVLNRFVNGAGGSLSRQIALNGTINSTDNAVSGTQAGSIWFYNAGGILIGSSGVINVGSLVLTTNDIVTTGGLIDPATGIRFRAETPDTTAAVTVNGRINASRSAAGSSYVALVAPRVAQNGIVNVDGSAAYVAAESADILIRTGGLFDINVQTGAKGGQAITHSGITTGPEQQASGPAQRIYMVAIPKNEAVSMLVSGRLGYLDATTAVTNSDGAIILSAGYNVTNGSIAATPVNATAANITVNDTIFHSDVTAHASGDFLGRPLADIPPPPPLTSVPPPNPAGRIVVQGNALFVGDTSATLNIDTGHQAAVLGNLTVTSGGTAVTPGNTAIILDGGSLGVQGSTLIAAPAFFGTATGDTQGGNASLTISNGGQMVANGDLTLSADAYGGFDDGGLASGDGTGGSVAITVTGTGSSLSSGDINAHADGNAAVPSSGFDIPDTGGTGTGGNVTIRVQNGGSLSTTGALTAQANGQGGFGLIQSGTGRGGNALIEVTGAGTSLQAGQTSLIAAGRGGGGSVFDPLAGQVVSLNGGDGIGGTTTLRFNATGTTASSAGNTRLDASAEGGSAGGETPSGENATGGNATGGTTTIEVLSGNAEMTSLDVNAAAFSGDGRSGSGTTGRSGDALGGTINISATGTGSTLDLTGGAVTLFADGTASTDIGENAGSGAGGRISVSATGGGTIGNAAILAASAFGGSSNISPLLSAGSGTGGTIDILADTGGSISAQAYQARANASVVNTSGNNGAAQGGNVSMIARGGGGIFAISDGLTVLEARAIDGASADGGSATGGTIRMIADGGTISLLGASLEASATSGGYDTGGPSLATGGTIAIRVGTDPDSRIAVDSLEAYADAEASAIYDGFVETPGDARGGTVTVDVQGGSLTTTSTAFGLNLSATGYGGTAGEGRGGSIAFTQTGGDVNIRSLTLNADGVGGQSGAGVGGSATLHLSGGSFFAGGPVMVTASGLGGEGVEGNDDPDFGQDGGVGGIGQGGTATITIDGTAVVGATRLGAFASGTGGAGGDFFSYGLDDGIGGVGGTGTGGNATINLVAGSLTTNLIEADAGGFGGAGGTIYTSFSGGPSVGLGIGGNGGDGLGGTATLGIGATTLSVGEGVLGFSSRSIGQGGDGGYGSDGGNGGNGAGGLAQAILDNRDAGVLALTLDSTATGGNGGTGGNGNGGNGGYGQGGVSSLQATGANAKTTITQANFRTGGTGGNGGSAFTESPATPAVGGRGGDGGAGYGGEIDVAAIGGATITLGSSSGGSVLFGSTGIGGNGGRGADNNGAAGLTGGDGGTGGGAVGGAVHLVADGGTITSNGAPLSVTVNGVSGTGGDGGTGSGGNGGAGATVIDQGGRVIFETLATSSAGQISLADTAIQASGGLAGRIEMRSAGNIAMSSLTAEALGLADPTNNDTDVAPAGIFLAANGGSITTAGDMALRTDSSVGAYAQGGGQVSAGGNLTIDAGDQVDIRHDNRGAATTPTLFATGNLAISAVTGISGAPGSLLGAGNLLRLGTTGASGNIVVDRLAGNDIVVTTAGLAGIGHAEAVDDFTADAGSFRTGLNSLITGGDISVTAAGTIDLGNSTAGGSVYAAGQSIAFATVNAGTFVSFFALGTGATDGVFGNNITAQANGISMIAPRVGVTGTVQAGGALRVTGTVGDVAFGSVDVASDVSIFARTNLTGAYRAGGNINLVAGGNATVEANAAGGYVAPTGGPAAEGYVFVDAGGNATLTNSSAATMLGVHAGGAASLNGAAAGEDVFVLAGTTATLSNISAGDDLTVQAPGAISVTNAATTGTGPDGRSVIYAASSASPGLFLQTAATPADLSNIVLTGGADIDGNNLNAFNNLTATASGTMAATGPLVAGNDLAITANAVRLTDIPSSGDPIDTIRAGRDIAITSASDISGGGALKAGRNLTLDATGSIAITAAESGDGGQMALSGTTGIDADQLYSRGATTLTADNGAVRIGVMGSLGDVGVSANSLDIGTSGPITFANIMTDVGDATIGSDNLLIVDNATIAGTARFGNSGEHMIIRNLTANAAQFAANEMLSMTSVSVTNDLTADAGTTIAIDGVVTGRNISLASADIDIASTGRVGTAGVTQGLTLANNDDEQQTFVGGTGTKNGYHVDADELTRLFGTDILIFAPEVNAAGIDSVGSVAPPDVIIDGFTMTGGASGSNLGANGSLTIRTPGKMRILGNVQLTGLSDDNALNLLADDALEVILGQGTVRLLGANNAPGGQLNMASDDIIVATQAAIADVANATTTDAINTRLGQNDGVTLDEGALFARGIRFTVDGGVYVQNSGTGTAFAERRGLTFGSGGLTVQTGGSSRIVINGVQLGPNGQITGLDTIPLLTIAPGSTGTPGSFDPRSTFNGCLIANTGSCTAVTFDPGNLFPVQDVIEEESDSDGDSKDGNSLPTALITMRDLDPLSGEPLLDDPVTGAGNDDLWTPTSDTQQP